MDVVCYAQKTGFVVVANFGAIIKAGESDEAWLTASGFLPTPKSKYINGFQAIYIHEKSATAKHTWRYCVRVLDNQARNYLLVADQAELLALRLALSPWFYHT